MAQASGAQWGLTRASGFFSFPPSALIGRARIAMPPRATEYAVKVELVGDFNLKVIRRRLPALHYNIPISSAHRSRRPKAITVEVKFSVL